MSTVEIQKFQLMNTVIITVRVSGSRDERKDSKPVIAWAARGGKEVASRISI